ncbi:MAG TPA: hypothetical protein VN722_11700 [Hanamia sp.]|nr:hypothetical protein [Hanamia sp.]
MEAIRKIIVPATNKIVITIPDHFIGKRIEVIAIKIEDEPESDDQKK